MGERRRGGHRGRGAGGPTAAHTAPTPVRSIHRSRPPAPSRSNRQRHAPQSPAHSLSTAARPTHRFQYSFRGRAASARRPAGCTFTELTIKAVAKRESITERHAAPRSSPVGQARRVAHADRHTRIARHTIRARRTLTTGEQGRRARSERPAPHLRRTTIEWATECDRSGTSAAHTRGGEPMAPASLAPSALHRPVAPGTRQRGRVSAGFIVIAEAEHAA